MYLATMGPARGFAPLFLLAMFAACAPAGAPPAPAAVPRSDTTGAESALPPVPAVRGPLDIRVVYPGPAVRVAARDSSFLYGSLGSGDATLTINGAIGGLSSATVTKTGSGRLVLAGENAYSGETFVNQGVLNVRHDSALGATSGKTTVASLTALEVEGGITAAEPLTLNGAGWRTLC